MVRSALLRASRRMRPLNRIMLYAAAFGKL
jgi:hypothetical protein